MSRTVVITGGTRGIGRALADAFLARECRVAICGRDQDTVARAVGELTIAHGPDRVVGMKADVASASDLRALWDLAATGTGRVDVWINNAGLSHGPHHVADLDEAAMRAVVDANIIGSLLGSKVAVAAMRAQGGGVVYNLMGFGTDGTVRPGMSVYGMTKYALRYLTDALAAEVEGSPVRVGSISPGVVPTRLLEQTLNPARAEIQRKILNTMADEAGTVAPWIAERVLADEGNGTRIRWMTPAKARWRSLTARMSKRDVFDRRTI